MARDFFNKGTFLKELNQIYIVVVPKTSEPTRMEDFWPINVHNMGSKIHSKVLVNRLKPLLDMFNSPSPKCRCPLNIL